MYQLLLLIAIVGMFHTSYTSAYNNPYSRGDKYYIAYKYNRSTVNIYYRDVSKTAYAFKYNTVDAMQTRTCNSTIN